MATASSIVLSTALFSGCTRTTPVTAPQGGRKLLSGAEGAALTVLGRIDGVQRIDHDGYKARLKIERVVCGTPPSAAVIDFAWEELSERRPLRFGNGDRAVLALQPLPSASLWRSRFPGASSQAPVFVVAAEGDAFLVHPDEVSLSTLTAYLGLAREQRSAAVGASALAQMIARAAPELAVAAAVLLNEGRGESPLPAAAEEDLLRALESRQLPQLQTLLIDIAARYRVAKLRPALEALAQRNPILALNALMAVAAINGRLSDEQAQALLADPDPVRRIVAVRLARGALVERLLEVMHDDVDGKVRAAAAHALIEQRGSSTLAQVLPALGDREPFVRAEVALALGSLGAAAVPSLLTAAQTGSPEVAQAAVLALESVGAPGISALRDLAENHPDNSVHRLAKLALGHLEDPH